MTLRLPGNDNRYERVQNPDDFVSQLMKGRTIAVINASRLLDNCATFAGPLEQRAAAQYQAQIDAAAREAEAEALRTAPDTHEYALPKAATQAEEVTFSVQDPAHATGASEMQEFVMPAEPVELTPAQTQAQQLEQARMWVEEIRGGAGTREPNA